MQLHTHASLIVTYTYDLSLFLDRKNYKLHLILQFRRILLCLTQATENCIEAFKLPSIKSGGLTQLYMLDDH